MTQQVNGKTRTHWGKKDAGRAAPADVQFLKGPQPRGWELFNTFKIGWELFNGIRRFHFMGPCVTVFGSARFKEEHPCYAQAREVGALLARAGFTVMTGGGPGIMEAANRGARDAGGRSVGCNIKLPREQHHNPYLDHWITFEHFFIRKLMLRKYSYAFIACPGGFGTLDEVFETLTLIQTEKILDFPVGLLGTEYWKPLVTFLRERLLKEKMIDEADVDKLRVSDSPEELVEWVREIALRQFGLSYSPKIKRRWYLGE